MSGYQKRAEREIALAQTVEFPYWRYAWRYARVGLYGFSFEHDMKSF